MPRTAVIGWLVALSLMAPTSVTQAASAPASEPTVHTLVTPPLRAAARPSRATPVTARASAPAAAKADRLIVTFAHADPTAARGAHAAAGATPITASAHGRVHVVRVDPAQRGAAMATYRQQPGVTSVSVDRRSSVAETPSDPLYADPSGAGYTRGWSLDAIGAPTAWNVTHGDGIEVAVLDTGVLSTHEDLAGHVVASRDFTGSPVGATDAFGHGTHVAGIIAASENNGHGLAGVAPRAKLLDGKILGDDGSGYLSDEIAGIQWAVQQGAKVINLSLGATGACDPSEQAVIDDAWAAGVVIVAAAGNDSAMGAIAPANCNHVIGVGASTVGGPSAPGTVEGPAWFSNHGPGVLVAAPGDHVYSSMLTSGTVSNSTGYGPLSGTSMATPQVSGAAALVWASQYGTSNQAVVSRLESTADAIGGTGTDWTYGRIDAATAVGARSLVAPAEVDDGLGADLATQTSTTQLSAHWTAVSGAAGYEYAIGTAAGLADVVGWTDNATALAMTQTGLNLSPNTTYYASVRAYDSVGVRYAAASSNGLKVVAAALAAPASVSDGGTSASLSSLSASWSSVPGAVGYEYAISSTTPGALNVLGWTDAGAATQVTRTGLNLTNALTYYFSVRGYSASGQRSASTTSSGVRALVPTSLVNDGASADQTYQAATDHLSANWTGVAAAGGYEYAFGTTPGGVDVVAWTASNSTAATASSLALVPGATYYASVRVDYDATTRSSLTTSNGVSILRSPTSVMAASSQSTTTPLSATWNGVTGASGYQYAIGSTPGGTDVLGWADAGLATSMTRASAAGLLDGHTYYISVRAYDAVGGLTAAVTSSGTTVRAPAPPSAPSGGASGGGGGSHGGGGGSSGGGGGSAPASAGGSAPASGGSASATTAPAPASQPSASQPSASQPSASHSTSGKPIQPAASEAPAPTASPIASMTLAPQPLDPSLPAPLGYLRLLDNLGALTASGSGPTSVSLAPSDVELAAVGGDATQLVIGYLDPTSNTWTGLPTILDASGHLTATAPQAGTLAVFRQAPTFWVVPNTDLPLSVDSSGDLAGTAPAGATVEIVATQGAAYEVQLGDGTFAWLDGTQATMVPAPDALPPLPAPVTAPDLVADPRQTEGQ